MASTSSPSSSTSASSSQVWNHDVYLSFREKDTGNNFVDYLHTALQQRGIHSYIDTESLSYGAPIFPTLLKAIQESRIVVVVLSKSYPESPRCLKELEHIMKGRKERDQIVMPIFYHVDPWVVRKQRGLYGEAFKRHHQKNDLVESWRKALEEVSNLAGWELNSFIREATFIEQVVDAISNKLLLNMGIGTRLSDLNSGDGGKKLISSSFCWKK